VKTLALGLLILGLVLATPNGVAWAQSNSNTPNSNGSNGNNGNGGGAGNANVPIPPRPPPIQNSYGLLIPGVTDAQVQAAVAGCASSFLAGQKPPPGFSYDEWGRLIGSDKQTSLQAVQGVGIDGFRDKTEFWLSQSSVQACALKSLTGQGGGSAKDPYSQSGLGPSKVPENVPALNSNNSNGQADAQNSASNGNGP